MYVAHLSLHDFRSYASLELELTPGVTSFVGRNGQGKTNIVEAIDYLSRLSSHRVASEAPLVRLGGSTAVVRAAVVRQDRRAVLEIEISPGKSNRARINKSALPRARELIGLVRTVLFSPDDLALVKGDPAERRRFADDLLVLASPKYAGTRADYDRVLKQRNTLLKTASMARRAGRSDSALATLEVWDARLAGLGAQIMGQRMALVDTLQPLVGRAYQAVAHGAGRDDARLRYKPSLELPAPVSADPVDPGDPIDRVDVSGEESGNGIEAALLAELDRRRRDELDRGVTLVGPHRDDITFELGEHPVKGYASHGESWSFALALRLAAYELLRESGDDPVLILDDVFAELDAGRRSQLAALVADAQQVLITAAVPADIPAELGGRRYLVADGVVSRERD